MNKNGNPASLVASHPGNTNAAKYGVYSPRLTEPRAAEIVAQLRQQFEFSVTELIALGEFARSTAVLEAIDRDLLERGVVDKRGEARSLLNYRSRIVRELDHWLSKIAPAMERQAASDEEMITHYEGEDVDFLGPDGPAVERVNADGSIRKELGRVLHRLVVEQHVRSDDIVVLTPRTAAASELMGQVGAFTVTEAPTRRNDVRLSSIYRFLGLEARAVVLCEIPPDTGRAELKRLLYVATSRARALLVVIQ